jgi:nucleoporin NUP82
LGHQEKKSDANFSQTIKTTVSDDIRQLIISPHSNYLAILTTHTVHIALLPDSSHLTAHDTTPLRLKIYTLGPVTHVTTQSAVVSALWHPLGVNGSCIVTITEDAVVRVWELSTADRWSFDRPTLAIDLKKLADGTSLDQDFGASVSGINKGFSPDSFEMEVAAACFGGRGSGGWSPMTLWIAMREGDVYALCPLLPEKWAPPPALIPSLSVSIVAKVASMEDDPEISEQLKLLSQQQLAWMSDLDNQDPVIHEAPMGEPSAEIYTRPVKPGRVPKLQGPFEFDLSPEESEDELDSLLSDIYVIGGKIDAEELMYGEEDDLEMDDVDQEGLSMNLVCLLSSSGRVSICLDLYGIEAQWLPNTKSKFRRFVEDLNPPSLLTFQIMDTLKSEEVDEDSWPMFSSDVNSRYSFFVTHASSITFLSLSPWVFRLESELRANTTSGVDFRIDLLVKNTNTIRERLITQPAADDLPPLAAAIAILDPDLGYFLLTSTPHGPIALSFDAPELSFSPPRSRSPTYEDEPQPQPLLLCAPRQVYEPSRALFAQSSLPEFLDSLRRGKYKRVLHEPIRLSPATLTILTDAHKILSEETHRLGTAAAELFRRCERLQIELREQIERANEVANRVDAVVGDDADVDPGVLGGNEGVEKRLHDVKLRQLELAERVDRVKKKASKGAAGRQLSEKEKAWIEEIETLGSALLSSTAADPHPNKQKRETPSERFDAVTKISSTILANFSAAEEKFSDDSASVSTTGRSVRVPTELRKQKVAEVMELLEREGALVEGAKSRLEKLNLAS